MIPMLVFLSLERHVVRDFELNIFRCLDSNRRRSDYEDELVSPIDGKFYEFIMGGGFLFIPDPSDVVVNVGYYCSRPGESCTWRYAVRPKGIIHLGTLAAYVEIRAESPKAIIAGYLSKNDCKRLIANSTCRLSDDFIIDSGESLCLFDPSLKGLEYDRFLQL